MRSVRLPRLAVPALVLLALTACSAGDDGAPGVGEGLLPLQADVPLGFDERGDGFLRGAFLDSTGSPVAIATMGAQVQVFRGPDPQPVPVAAFGPLGTVGAAALAPDGTLVVLGLAGERSDVSIVRIGPDDAAQVLPVTGAAAQTDLMTGADHAALSADGSTAVLAWAVRDDSQGFPVVTGEVETWRVDTATGAITGTSRTRVAGPAADVPGVAPPAAVRDVVVTPDGGAAVAVDVAEGDVVTGQLVRLHASFGPGTPVRLQEEVAGEFDRYLAVDASGTVYATTIDGDGVDGTLRVLSLAPGATGPTVVVELADETRTTGLAVSPDGTRAYLTDLISGGGAGLSNEVSVIDLAAGAKVGETVLCEEGRVQEAVLTPGGDALLVPGACGSDGEIHLYVLGA